MLPFFDGRNSVRKVVASVVFAGILLGAGGLWYVKSHYKPWLPTEDEKRLEALTGVPYMASRNWERDKEKLKLPAWDGKTGLLQLKYDKFSKRTSAEAPFVGGATIVTNWEGEGNGPAEPNVSIVSILCSEDTTEIIFLADGKRVDAFKSARGIFGLTTIQAAQLIDAQDVVARVDFREIAVTKTNISAMRQMLAIFGKE